MRAELALSIGVGLAMIGVVVGLISRRASRPDLGFDTIFPARR
jgi:hypothetical protein